MQRALAEARPACRPECGVAGATAKAATTAGAGEAAGGPAAAGPPNAAAGRGGRARFPGIRHPLTLNAWGCAGARRASDAIQRVFGLLAAGAWCAIAEGTSSSLAQSAGSVDLRLPTAHHGHRTAFGPSPRTTVVRNPRTSRVREPD